MLERRLKEVELLQKKYGPVIEYGAGMEWVLFKEFRLPDGWNRATTELLLIVPPGYPSTAPDNFFVTVGLRTANGGAISNYSEPVTQLGREWGQFSFHLDDEWKPGTNIVDGDNLQTFMIKATDRLREVN